MFTLASSDIFSVLFIVFLLLIAVIGTFSPFTIAKLITIWPKFIFPRLFSGERIHPKAYKAIHLIDDPEAYADEFRNQLLLIRVVGIIATLMLCCIFSFIFLDFGTQVR